MVDVTDEDPAGDFLFLEMALQAERLISLVQHSLIDGAVRRMTANATFANRFVFVNKWSALLSVTLETGVVRAQEGDASAFD